MIINLFGSYFAAPKIAVVPAEKLSNMVVTSLKKVNKAAAEAFVEFRNKKLKAKNKK